MRSASPSTGEPVEGEATMRRCEPRGGWVASLHRHRVHQSARCPERVETSFEPVGLADRSLEDLAVVAGRRDDVDGPVGRQAERLRDGAVAAEQPLGAQVRA